jgi:Zn-dependent membrane protease YugP
LSWEYAIYAATLVAILLAFYSQIKVSSTFRKYSGFVTFEGLSGAEVARKMLDENGLYHVRIERINGHLSDHYDPRTEVLRLSRDVYDSVSVAAIGVAAHEAGHAVQHSVGYFPLKLRSRLVPVTSFASRFSWIIILLGTLFLMFDGIIGYYVVLFGIALFAINTLFQLITLPCEFNASARAMRSLKATGYYSADELSATRKVLSAAAFTYVASTLVSLLQLLRLLIRFTGNRRR